MDMIKIEGLTKSYKDVTAVDNLSLSVEKGELFALLGVNGAGKTTTIKTLCCLCPADSGKAEIGGYDVFGQSAEVKRIIGVSPQETAVAKNLTVYENLVLMGGVHGFSKEKSRQVAEDLIGKFKLDKIRDKQAKKLSGGWQRRLSIAMALVSDPQLLFLDEPTLGLDVIARSELWDVIKALKGKMTIILTTHYLEEAESLSDRVGVMKSGKLLFCGTSEELISSTGADSFEDAFIKTVKEEAV
ncbi:MAG: ABC transporter ATP-binding protein [Oscillospiraceae bacterium]|nr:ABC transporter ATP-binding protein [Oscillospiraceae bacterium]